jgi:hypothetical protein
MGIWMNNSQSGYNRCSGTPAYLPAAHAAGWERVRQAGLLRSGQHRHYFLRESRTQFDFPEMEVQGRVIRPYVAYNLCGLISNKSGDLLFGQVPTLSADNPRQQEALQELVDRCNLLPMLHSLAVNASAEGDCYIEAVEYDGDAYLQEVDGQEIYPVGKVRPDGQHAAYVRCQVDDDRKLLLVSTYKPGSIERELYEITDTGERGPRKDVNVWPDRTRVWGDVVQTGLSVNLITWIPNLLLHGKAVSDYDGCIDQQDKVNAANTQIARILAKHADPFMAFPRESFDENGNIKVSQKAIAKGSTPGSVPEYITWSGELEAAMKDRTFAVNAMLTSTETAPVLLGMEEGAAAEAFRTVRIRAFNSLSKAQRKSLYFSVGLKWALRSAQELENTLNGKAGYEIGPIGVTLRDGIPVDDKEQADTIATLRSAQAISRKRMVSMQISDPAAAAAEEGELAKEAEAGMPSILLGNEPAGDAKANFNDTPARVGGEKGTSWKRH